MAYISCLPGEPNSYVIVQNLSRAGLLFNLLPWITSRKVTMVQLEPYQRCPCSPHSHLSRMGHKSINYTSESTINIMNNWERVFKSNKTPVCLPASDSLLFRNQRRQRTGGQPVRGMMEEGGGLEVKQRNRSLPWHDYMEMALSENWCVSGWWVIIRQLNLLGTHYDGFDCLPKYIKEWQLYYSYTTVMYTIYCFSMQTLIFNHPG